jgi:prepilin-type N-terminal cleavage/methylation domain-containing protein
MKLLFKKASGFTRLELLVCLLVIGVLAVLAIPRLASMAGIGRSVGGPLGNARQLQLAIQTMSLDTYSSGGNGMEWTMLASHGKVTPVSLETFFRALVDNHYLTRADLVKLLTAPGKEPTESDLTARNIAFKFFQVDEDSPADQPLMVTANWQPTGLTDDAPYGKKGFVVFDKGGKGGIYKRPGDATDPKIFPSGSKDGHPYR